MMLLYRFLLYLYPSSFRAEYKQELLRLFRDRRRAAKTLASVLWFWLSEIVDVLITASATHWDILRQDLRYCARSLFRSPGFAMTAIVVTGLGIGATTAAYSVMDRVLLHPLPFDHPERLVQLWQSTPAYHRIELSPPNFYDWRRMSRSFEAMSAYASYSWTFMDQGDPKRLDGTAVTPEFFNVLDVKPALGRLFKDEDGRVGVGHTVILSYSFWQDVFGGSPDVLTKTIRLDNDPYAIIGVMPKDFLFPDRSGQIWTALPMANPPTEARDDLHLDAIGKLKRGVAMENARAELAVITDQLAKAYPKENASVGANLNALSDQAPNETRMLLWASFGAALCVLLIACTNLANLLLAKGAARRKELAVRSAIGAGRERIVRQMLTESAVLAVAGGTAGILVAKAAVPLLSSIVPDQLPLQGATVLEPRVLIFTLILTLLTGFIFGILPAWHISRGVDQKGLREASRSGIGGHHDRLRSVLVIAEVTVSLLLVVSAGLLLRALWRVQSIDPGFRADSVIAIQTWLPMQRYAIASTRNAFYAQVLSEVRALPGVSNASCISSIPMGLGGGGIWPVTGTGDETRERDASGFKTVAMRLVGSGYFGTMEIPLREGRDIRETDTLDSPAVAVVSESFARRYWPDRDAVGQKFHFAFDNFPFAQQDRLVVGVVGDVRFRGLERTNEPQVYLSYKQLPDRTAPFYSPREFVIRSAADVATVMPSIRRIVRKADPELPISAARPLREVVGLQTVSRSTQMRLVAAFAVLSLLLASIGIYGLLSFAVGQRSQEFGLRLALGADASDIRSMVLREGSALAGIGSLLGLTLSYFTARSMQALLAGVGPLDPATVLVAILVALAMTLFGSIVPAVRAMRIDPVSVIRPD